MKCVLCGKWIWPSIVHAYVPGKGRCCLRAACFDKPVGNVEAKE